MPWSCLCCCCFCYPTDHKWLKAPESGAAFQICWKVDSLFWSENLAFCFFQGALWVWEILRRNTLDLKKLAKGKSYPSYLCKTMGQVFCWRNIKHEDRQTCSDMIRFRSSCVSVLIRIYNWGQKYSSKTTWCWQYLICSKEQSLKDLLSLRHVGLVCLFSWEKSYLYASK